MVFFILLLFDFHLGNSLFSDLINSGCSAFELVVERTGLSFGVFLFIIITYIPPAPHWCQSLEDWDLIGYFVLTCVLLRQVDDFQAVNGVI